MNQGLGQAACMKVRGPEVSTAMGAVSRMIEELAQNVDELCVRIAPVRRTEPECPDEAKELEESSSVPIAQELYAMSIRIKKIKRTVSTALGQLEI